MREFRFVAYIVGTFKHFATFNGDEHCVRSSRKAETSFNKQTKQKIRFSTNQCIRAAKMR